MSKLLDLELVQQRLTALPIETYEAGDVVLAAGTTTGKVLVLKHDKRRPPRISLLNRS